MNKKRILDAVIVFILAVVINIVLSLLLGQSLGVLTTAITEIGFLLPCALFIRKRNDSPKERLALRLPTIKSFFAGAFVCAGATTFSTAVTYALYPLYYKNAVNPDTELFTLFDGVSPYAALLCIAILPAVCEEMLFRGYLQSTFPKDRKYAVLAIGFSSVLFCIAHLSLYKVPTTLVIGIAFGYIAYKTGSILITAILHFMNNANALILYYAPETSSEAAETLIFKDNTYYYIAGISAALSLVLIFIGIRLFAEKKLRFIYKIIPLFLAVVVSGYCVTGIAKNESEVYLDIYSNEVIDESEHIEKKIRIEKNTLCLINTTINCPEGVNAELKLTDKKGEEIYVYDGYTQGSLLIEKGEYILSLDIKADSEDIDAKCPYAVQIIGFGEYETKSED